MPLRMQLLLSIPIPPITAKRDALTGDAPNTVPWSTLISPAIGGNGKDFENNDVTADDTALILYTSGTTGAPKGAMLSHANILANCVMGKAWVPGLGDKPERFLAALPFFHVYGMTTVVALGGSVGASITLLPAPQMPAVMHVIKEPAPTWAPGVATLYDKAVAEAEEKGLDTTQQPIATSISRAATLPVRNVARWEAFA